MAAAACIALALGCGQQAPIKIGFIGALSGKVANLGVEGRDGALLAIEELNAEGGVRGSELRLIVEDDEHRPEVAALAAHRLSGKGVKAIIGPMTSDMALAVAPEINKRRIVTISPTVSSDAFTGQDDWLFRVNISTRETGRCLARHIWEHGNRSVLCVYDMDNRRFTESYKNRLYESFAELGGLTLKSVSFHSSKRKSLRRLAQECAKSNPDAIAMAMNSMDVGLFCQRYRAINPDTSLYSSLWGISEEMFEYGARAINNVHFTQAIDMSSSSPGIARFREAFRKRFGYEATFASAHGYEAAQALAEALRLNIESPREALPEMEFDGLAERLRFDQYGDAQRKCVITKVIDSQKRLLSSSE